MYVGGGEAVMQAKFGLATRSSLSAMAGNVFQNGAFGRCQAFKGLRPDGRTLAFFPDNYEHVASLCQQLNGSVAAPDQDYIIKWIAKRMFEKGIDQTLVALRKIESRWFWIKEEKPKLATNITWREDVPSKPDHTQALITVETVKVESDAEEIYYNYDHYVNVDRSYGWYGFTTRSDIYRPDNLKPIYYVCHYTSEPDQSLIMPPDETVEESQEKNTDPCVCSTDAQIKLSKAEDTQTFSSPGYPKNYCSDNNCRWTVKTSPDLVVKLEWTVFSTENGFDFVSVHDGELADSPVISTCTGVHCPSVQSSSSKLHIHFSADHVTTDIGFRAKVTAIPPDACYCNKLVEVSLENVQESFAFSSPDFPNPYCPESACAWSIQAPTGNGVELVVNSLDLEDTDFLLVYDGNNLARNCTNEICERLVSSSEIVRIDFVSDSHDSQHEGFAVVATAIENFCRKQDLNAGSGSISFSSERDDGLIPNGANARLKCAENARINNTFSDVQQSTVCNDRKWGHLDACVPVCGIETQLPSPNSDIVEVCKFESITDMPLVAAGHSIRVETHSKTGEILETARYECTESSVWSPTTPICHTKMGILMIGGDKGSAKLHHTSMELVSPVEHKSTLLSATLLEGRQDLLSSLESSGQVLIGSGTIKNGIPTTSTELIDLNAGATSTGPPLIQEHKLGASARLDGETYVCGGMHTYVRGTSSCEVLRHGRWTMAKNMNKERKGLAMVAMDGCLYAISGSVADENQYTTSVERYCPKEAKLWTFIAPISEGRTSLGAAVLESSIIICGGVRDWMDVITTCERYHVDNDVWNKIAGLLIPRFGFSMVVLDGVVYAFGGQETSYPRNENIASSIEIYHEATDSWKESQIKLIDYRFQGTAVLVPLIY